MRGQMMTASSVNPDLTPTALVWGFCGLVSGRL
jgi:hypothetical protein